MKAIPMEVSCQDVNLRRTRGDEFILLDCREQAEAELASIDGSVLFPMSDIGNRLDDLSCYRQSEIVVYCHLGGRSLQVAMWLRQQGFEQVQSMAGGIDEWSLEIDPQMSRY